MWRRPSDMALDQNTNCCNTQNGPPKCTRGVDPASWHPNSSPSKTQSSHLDPSAPGCLQTAVTETPLIARLHGLSEESEMEALKWKPTPQDREVSRHILKQPMSATTTNSPTWRYNDKRNEWRTRPKFARQTHTCALNQASQITGYPCQHNNSSDYGKTHMANKQARCKASTSKCGSRNDMTTYNQAHHRQSHKTVIL